MKQTLAVQTERWLNINIKLNYHRLSPLSEA